MDDRLPVCPSSGRSEEHTSELQSLALPDVLPIYHTNRRSLADHARIVGGPEGMAAPISSWTIDFRFARHPAAGGREPPNRAFPCSGGWTTVADQIGRASWRGRA